MNPGRELDAVMGQRGGRIERSCAICLSRFLLWRSDAVQGRKKYCSVKCGQVASRRIEGIVAYGRRFIVDAHGYHVSSDGKSVRLNRLTWEKERGAIPEGFVVHHRNGDKRDNRIDNLQLLDWAQHTREHSLERWAQGSTMRKEKKLSVCSECDRPAKAKGLCTMHYQRRKAKERGRWL